MGRRVHRQPHDPHCPGDEGLPDRHAKTHGVTTPRVKTHRVTKTKAKRQGRDQGQVGWTDAKAGHRHEHVPPTLLTVGCTGKPCGTDRDAATSDRPDDPRHRDENRHRAASAFEPAVCTEFATTAGEAIGRMRLGHVDLLVVGETDLPDQPLRWFVQKVTSAWPGMSWAMWRSVEEPDDPAADELWARRHGAAAVVDGDEGWEQLLELAEQCSRSRQLTQRVAPSHLVPTA